MADNREDESRVDQELSEGLASVRWTNEEESALVADTTRRASGRISTLQRVHGMGMATRGSNRLGIPQR